MHTVTYLQYASSALSPYLSITGSKDMRKEHGHDCSQLFVPDNEHLVNPSAAPISGPLLNII
jgi:hypothetical protein